MSVAALDIVPVADRCVRSSRAHLRVVNRQSVDARRSVSVAAGRSAHVKDRRYVRPDMPCTYGSYAVRSVPENMFMYVPQRNVASPKARIAHSSVPTSCVSAPRVRGSRASAATVANVPAPTSRRVASRRVASMQAGSRYAASRDAGARVAEPLLTSAMKTVLFSGLLIGMMGIFFALGLHAALGTGLIG